MSAVISECGFYRYVLGRNIVVRKVSARKQRGFVLWVMLNPSTADAELDDPTIKRVIEFTRSWGFQDLVVVNLYGYRATDPTELLGVQDPVGPLNDEWVWEVSKRASKVVVGWGKNAKPERAKQVFDILTVDNPVVYCLGTNNDGSPKHPLYLKGNTVLEPWDLPV